MRFGGLGAGLFRFILIGEMLPCVSHPWEGTINNGWVTVGFSLQCVGGET